MQKSSVYKSQRNSKAHLEKRYDVVLGDGLQQPGRSGKGLQAGAHRGQKGPDQDHPFCRPADNSYDQLASDAVSEPARSAFTFLCHCSRIVTFLCHCQQIVTFLCHCQQNVTFLSNCQQISTLLCQRKSTLLCNCQCIVTFICHYQRIITFLSNCQQIITFFVIEKVRFFVIVNEFAPSFAEFLESIPPYKQSRTNIRFKPSGASFSF